MKKIKVGIIGGAGYTGGELIRLILRHPQCDLTYVLSKSNAGKNIYEVHKDLLGECDLSFIDEPQHNTDVLFLCLAHGDARLFIEKYTISPDSKIIDLSQDFRLKEHNSGDYIYGLPELNKDLIRSAQKIANPGCFATAIQLALLPLAKNNHISNDVQIAAITGSTGAGQSPSSTTHFSWRDSNISVYKAFTHQHLQEIEQSLAQLQPDQPPVLNFLPFRGNFTRGILATSYLTLDLSEEMATSLYDAYYLNHPFVWLSPFNPDIKQVINTNNCFIHLNKIKDNLLIISVIDNLLKGAVGQAVQNMNLMFGLEETSGLNLKPSAF
jgi:N-acetyl-gamma-glutamyl-phosphate reductase